MELKDFYITTPAGDEVHISEISIVPHKALLWAEKLKSGLFPQVWGYLKTNSGYCCWGVFCEAVAGMEGVKETGVEGYRFEDEMRVAPWTAREGFSNTFAINGAAISYFSLNDGFISSQALPQVRLLFPNCDKSLTFYEIGELLEMFVANYPGD